MSVSTVPSPCTRSCCLGLDDICMGCGRHLDEITGWQAASEKQKLLIIQLASERLRLKQQEKENIFQKIRQVPE